MRALIGGLLLSVPWLQAGIVAFSGRLLNPEALAEAADRLVEAETALSAALGEKCQFPFSPIGKVRGRGYGRFQDSLRKSGPEHIVMRSRLGLQGNLLAHLLHSTAPADSKMTAGGFSS